MVTFYITCAIEKALLITHVVEQTAYDYAFTSEIQQREQTKLQRYYHIIQ